MGREPFLLKIHFVIGWTLYVQWQARHTLVLNNVREASKKNSTNLQKRKSFHIECNSGWCSIWWLQRGISKILCGLLLLSERESQRMWESMNLLQSMNAFMQQKTPPCLLKYCKLTQYVICATRGLSVTTIKTKYVVWWRLDVVCDHGSCCLYCWTATKFNEILSDVTQAEIMFRLCLVTFLNFLPLTLWSMIFIPCCAKKKHTTTLEEKIMALSVFEHLWKHLEKHN